MNAVFSSATALLAPKFVQKYSSNDLTLTLQTVEQKLPQKLGIKLIIRNQTICLIGKWASVLEAHDILLNDVSQTQPTFNGNKAGDLDLQNVINKQAYMDSVYLQGKDFSKSKLGPADQGQGAFQPNAATSGMMYDSYPMDMTYNEVVFPNSINMTNNQMAPNQMAPNQMANNQMANSQVVNNQVDSSYHEENDDNDDLSANELVFHASMGKDELPEEPQEETQPDDSSKKKTKELKRNADGKIECPNCDDCFDDETSLKAHEKDAHTRPTRKRTPRKLQQQPEEPAGETFPCCKCSYRGKSLTHLKVHLIRRHAYRFECDECGKFFGYTKDLKKHKETIHGADSTAPSWKKQSKKTESQRENEPPTRIECSSCDKVFEDRSSLRQHRKAHHPTERAARGGKVTITGEPFPCEKCPYVGKSKAHLKVHGIRFHAVRHKCDECSKCFGYPKDLKRHKDTVHSAPQYYCKECNKYYKTKVIYEQHMECHQGPPGSGMIRPHSCKTCGKSYGLKTYLDLHIKNEHMRVRRDYVCEICGKNFKTNFGRQDHTKLIHGGIKPYKCATCFQSFPRKKSYQEHQNIHTGLKPNVCKICGAAFTHESMLRYHKRTHEIPVIQHCEICNKTFNHIRSLKTHLKTHTNTQRHMCTVCGKEFTQKGSLKRHEWLHRNCQPYKCSLCNKTSSDPSVIRRHVISVHQKDPKRWQESVVSNLDKDTMENIDGMGRQENLVTNIQKKKRKPRATNEPPPVLDRDRMPQQPQPPPPPVPVVQSAPAAHQRPMEGIDRTVNNPQFPSPYPPIPSPMPPSTLPLDPHFPPPEFHFTPHPSIFSPYRYQNTFQ